MTGADPESTGQAGTGPVVSPPAVSPPAVAQSAVSPPAVSWRAVSVRKGGVDVLSGVDLDVEPGAWLSVIGPNGAGKTTLLATLLGSSGIGKRGVSGSVALAGEVAADLSARDRARRLAFVPQHPVIPPGMPVFDYVVLGRVPHQGLRCAASEHDRRRAVAVLQRLGLDEFAGRRVDTLSGGERQRVVLARALVQDASLLVLDEPTSALDVGHQLDVLELLAEIRTERAAAAGDTTVPLTIITTVHDLTVAGQFADRLAVLADGRLVAAGTPAEVLTPERLARHWGVDATCTVDPDGSVSVTVRRRRERRAKADPAGQRPPVPTPRQP